MPKLTFPGQGRKRPLLDVPIQRLHLDGENPRLPEKAQGKKESELLTILYQQFNLDELAQSLANNGFFDEEPLVAFPPDLPTRLANTTYDSVEFLKFIAKDSVHFTVVEGNRRLATAKILLDNTLRAELRIKHWPTLSDAVAEDLKKLPAIIYMRRDEVVPYLAVRHIVGIQKWNSYAKARYIANMIRKGISIKDLEEQIGDKQGSIARSYLCYNLLEQTKDEFDFDVSGAQADFSLLLLAVGQGNIKRFLGLPRKLSEADTEQPISQDHLNKLRELMTWLFGDGKIRAVISESRDITNFLSEVVGDANAIAFLRNTGRLQDAYELTGGEEKMVLRYLATANSKLEAALGIVHRHKTDEVKAQIGKCEKTVRTLIKVISENE